MEGTNRDENNRDENNRDENNRDETGLSQEVQGVALRWILEHGVRDLARTVLRAAVSGEPPEIATVTTDVREFQECIAMLDAVPQARDGIGVLREANPYWKNLARNWAEIERTVRWECGTERMPPHWDHEISQSWKLIRKTLLERNPG